MVSGALLKALENPLGDGAAGPGPILLIECQPIPPADIGIRTPTNEPFIYKYCKPNITPYCCNEPFNDHLAWKRHIDSSHRGTGVPVK